MGGMGTPMLGSHRAGVLLNGCRYGETDCKAFYYYCNVVASVEDEISKIKFSSKRSLGHNDHWIT